MDETPLRVLRPLSIVIVLITMEIAAYIYLGWFWATVFGATALAALALWRAEGYGSANESSSVLLAQIVVLAAQLITYAEMIAFGFASAFASDFPGLVPPPIRFDESLFVAAFPLTLMSVFMSSAAVCIERYNGISFFVLCFSSLWSVVIAVALYGASIAAGHLLPGAWTAIVSLAAGGFVLVRVIRAKGGEK